MTRALVTAIAVLALTATLALAEPGVQVLYFDGVPHIELEGQYPQSRYTVFRASRVDGLFSPVSEFDLLCVASCFVDDYDAVPGETYWYRFDVEDRNLNTVSYGPFAVTIAAPSARAVDARVYPNPARGPSQVELYLRGGRDDAPLAVEATIHDLQGRRVASLHRGALARGVTRLNWNGRADHGGLLGVGVYFLRVVTPLGVVTKRITRVS